MFCQPDQPPQEAARHSQYECGPRFANHGVLLLRHLEEPVGYDPTIIPGWDSPTSPAFAVLRLTPYRLRVQPGTVMTEAHVAYRPPHKREIHKLANHAACYGTTNFAVSEVLPDYTGARRWWEIRSPNRKRGSVENARLAAIDFERLWRSVDGGTSVSPLREHQSALTDVQNSEFKATVPLEDFFREMTAPAPDSRLSQDELYSAVRAWFAEQGMRVPTKVALFRFARDHGSVFGVRVTNTDNRPAFHDIKLVPSFEAP